MLCVPFVPRTPDFYHPGVPGPRAQPSDRGDDLLDLDVYFDKQSDWRDSSSAAAGERSAPAQRGGQAGVGGGSKVEGDGEREERESGGAE